jgi:nicotinamidase-related amidase
LASGICSISAASYNAAESAYLVQKQVDTLVFCGVSTSGCIRASVIDGFSSGFSTFVVDECCFDRSQFTMPPIFSTWTRNTPLSSHSKS